MLSSLGDILIPFCAFGTIVFTRHIDCGKISVGLKVDKNKIVKNKKYVF
jgi:hypothetical protein